MLDFIGELVELIGLRRMSMRLLILGSGSSLATGGCCLTEFVCILAKVFLVTVGARSGRGGNDLFTGG